VVRPKENHMQLTEATTLDRKSGGSVVERSAVSLSWFHTPPPSFPFSTAAG
jgi:hypothetical protein